MNRHLNGTLVSIDNYFGAFHLWIIIFLSIVSHVSKDSSGLSFSCHISLACFNTSTPHKLSFFDLTICFGETEAFRWWNLLQGSSFFYGENLHQSIVNLEVGFLGDTIFSICRNLFRIWVNYNLESLHSHVKVVYAFVKYYHFSDILKVGVLNLGLVYRVGASL
jgi:hypothetical protein